MRKARSWRFGLALAVSCASMSGVSSSQPPAQQRTESGVEVWYDDTLAVSYWARVEGGWLVVEAAHEPGWHTYAMDNVTRAREKSGNARPETELPTEITPLDGLTIRGAWRQSPPVDLSTPDIQWYTWGFEGRSYFAARIEDASAPSSIQIDAQACTDSMCAMVEELVVPVDASNANEPRSVDPESLVVVVSDPE